MKQHSVPENIMDVHFKLFGSLTAKQFGYILGGGGVALGLFFIFRSLNATFLGWIFAGLSVILGLSLALIRINDQPFEIWLGNFLAAMFSSQKRVWKKSKKNVPHLDNKTVQTSQTQQPTFTQPQATVTSTQQQNTQVTSTQNQQTQANVSENKVPRHPFKDISKKNNMNNTQNQQSNPQQQNTENSQKGQGDTSPNLNVQQPVGTQANQQTSGQVQNQPQQTQKTPVQPQTQTQVQASSQQEKQLGQQPVAGKQVSGETYNIPGSAQGYVKVTNNQKQNRPITIPQKQTSSTGSEQGNDETSSQVSSPTTTSDKQQTNVQKVKTQVNQSSVKPNLNTNQSNAGRTTEQFNSQPSPSPKDTQPGVGINNTATKKTLNKASQFDGVIPTKQQTMSSSGVSASSDQDTEEKETTGSEDEVLKEENSALREKVAQYSNEKEKLENQLSEIQTTNTQLQQQNEQITKQLQEMQNQIEQMKKQKEEQENQLPDVKTSSSGNEELPEEQQEQAGSFTPKVYDGPSLSKKPNVVSGIVKTKDGKLLPGVTVIIKDPTKNPPRPIRAMTTNSLGQFITVSEIDQKGKYIIELSKNGYNFGRYEIEITGEMLPTYEFVAG